MATTANAFKNQAQEQGNRNGSGREKTALLTLDLQGGILGLVPAEESVVGQAATALVFARSQQILVVHVGLGFSEGHPEIADYPSRFVQVKQNNLSS
jgi:hypothetical protein